MVGEKYNNIETKIICCIYCLCFSLALFFNPTISAWGATPETYYYYISSCVFSLILLSKIHFSKKDILLSKLDLLCVAFAIYIVFLGYLTSGLSGIFIKDEILTFLIVTFSALVLKQFVTKEGHFFIVLLCLVVSMQIGIGLFQAIYSINYSVPIPTHVKGSFNNSGIFAIFLACFSPGIGYLITYYNARPVYSLLFKILSFLPISFAIMVQSRTAILLCLIVLTVHILKDDALLSKFKKMRFKLLLFIILLLFTGLSVFALYIKYPSVIGRLFIWETTLQMIIDKPFFGWGPGGFREQYLNYQATFFLNHTNHLVFYIAGQVYYVFNVPIQILVEGGIVGFALCIFLLIRIYRLKITDKVRAVYRNVFFLTILGGLFSYPFNISGIVILMSFCLIIIPPSSERKYKVGVLKIGLPILFVVLLTYSVNQYVSTLKWKEASQHVLDQTDLSFRQYNDVYGSLKHRGTYLYNYGAELFEAGNYTKSIKILNMCKQVYPSVECYMYLGRAHEQLSQNQLAIEYYSKASHIVPSLYTPRYFLLKLFYLLNDKKRVLQAANEILHMEVKVPSEEVKLIKKEAEMIVRMYDK